VECKEARVEQISKRVWIRIVPEWNVKAISILGYWLKIKLESYQSGM